MGVFDRLMRLFEKRNGSSYISEHAFRIMGSSASNPDSVLSALSVASACVARRAQGLASVPLLIYRNVGKDNASRAEDHPLYDVLNVYPNDYQSPYEFREFLYRSHDLYGNAYARIERDARGQVTALHPFPPFNVAIEQLANGRLRYQAVDIAQKSWTLLQEEMLHVRGSTRDGIYGQSPIAIARGALNLAISHAETASSLAENRLSPGGLVSMDGKLSEEQHEKLRKWLDSWNGGSLKAGKPLILDNGAKYSQLSFSPHDAEFLESRRLSNEDVARIFDCPPTSVGIVDRSTYSNTEQEALALVRNALMPFAARFESAFGRCLLTPTGRKSFFLRHDFSELLRGDMKTRFEAYRIAREMGVFSANDVRRQENEQPIPGGEIYNQPSNWSVLGQSQPPANPPTV
jgi:HK97 family phage portal protein